MVGCAATAAGLDAVVYCLGYGAPPLPTLLRGTNDEAVTVATHETPGGALIDDRGARLPGLFGVGLGFSDKEYTSGQGYAEAGFMPFAERAREIAARIRRGVAKGGASSALRALGTLRR